MEPQVIIIGAGVAGLAAAQRLKGVGVQSLIVEARNRIGGRIWTDHTYSPVELGAEFIHGAQAATWQVIAPAGFETEAWPRPVGSGPRRRFFRGNQPPTADTSAGAEGHFFPDEVGQQIMALCDRLERYQGTDQSVADLVAQWPEVDPALLPFALDRLACLEAADITRLSAKALAEERATLQRRLGQFPYSGRV